MRVFGENLDDDVKINKFKLEEECEIHPSIYAFYSQKQAELKAEVDRTKTELDRISTAKELMYRRNPPMDLKLTEAIVKALVEQDSEVQEAEDKHNRACEALYTMDAAVYSLNQRKSSLDNLTQLWIKSYYGSKDTLNVEEAIHARRNGNV